MAGPEDRETTIAFTDADEEMQVFTANRKLKSRLKKLGFEPEESEGSHDYFVVPTEYLQLRKPRDFSLTEDEKKERGDRLREVRKAAGIGEFSKKKPAASRKSTKKIVEEEEEELDEEFEDEDEEEEEVEVVKPRARKPAPSSRKPATKSRPTARKRPSA